MSRISQYKETFDSFLASSKEQIDEKLAEVDGELAALKELVIQESVSNISSLEKEALATKEKIDAYATEIFEGDEDSNNPSVKSVVNDYLVEIKADYENISELHSKANNYLGNIIEFEATAKNKTNEFIQEAEAIVKEHESTLKALEKDARSKLPWFTSVGLSHAFEENRKRHAKAEMVFRAAFLGAIASMLLVFFIDSYHIELSGDDLSPEAVLIHLLRILPLEAPLIWLGWVASKRIKQEARLQEEYQHKWAIASSFEGFSREAYHLDEDPEGRLESNASKLFHELIVAFARNPSGVIDTKDENAPWEKLLPSKKQKLVDNNAEK